MIMDSSAVICALVAGLIFANTWRGDFVYDDSRAIVSNEDLRPGSSWLDLWRHDFWGTPLDHSGSHQSWRPFCVLSFRLNYYWSGLNPGSYHLVNVALHSLVTLCVCLLIRPLIRRRWVRTLVGLIFAVHPIHCEAVASVVGRAELGMALHTLIALLLYQAHLSVRLEGSTTSQVGIHCYHGPTSSVLSRLLIRLVTICCYSARRQPHKTQYQQRGATAAPPPMVRMKAEASSVGPIWSNRWKSTFYLTTALMMAGAAILWKESGAAALPLCAILELHQLLNNGAESRKPQSTVSNQRLKPLRNLSLLGAVWASQLAVRCYMLGGNGTAPWFALADNPVARESSLFTRTLTFFYLPAFNFCLMLWPAWLSFDWSMDAIRPLRSICDPRNAVTFLFYTALTVLAGKILIARSRSLISLLGLSLMVIPFLPATNLLFYVGFVVAERVLYLPSVGFCILLGAGLDQLVISGRSFVKLSMLFALTVLALRTIQRNQDWASEEQLYRSGIPINPAKAYGNLAAILAQKESYSEAEQAYRQALTHRPNMAETHFNLALLLEIQGRHQEATSSYLQSIHYRPNLAAAYVNLGQLMIKQGRYDQALQWFAACTQLDSSGVRDPTTHRHHQVQALIRWGQAEIARGQAQRAIQLYKQALRRSPTTSQQLQTVYHSLGEAYELTADFRESERWFLQAVRQHHPGPNMSKDQVVAAHLTYARFLAKNASRHEEAEQLFRQAQLIAPTDPAVYMQSGQFLLDMSRTREAAESFVRAAHLAPGDFEAVFNAAATLREAKELDRAEHYYRKAVQLKPKDVEVYRNLGALLHIKGQWKEAEENYRTALTLSPDDRTTLTNLQRLHQLMASKGLLKPSLTAGTKHLTES